MKKSVALLLAVWMIAAVAGCKQETPINATQEETSMPATQNPDYTPGELMELVLDKANLPFYTDYTPVKLDAENSQYYLGITEKLELLQTEAVSAESMRAIPFSAVIVKVKDVKDVEAVKAAIHSGIEFNRWPHVSVGRIVVIDSGEYILIAMGRNCDNVVSAFGSILPEACGELLEK